MELLKRFSGVFKDIITGGEVMTGSLEVSEKAIKGQIGNVRKKTYHT